MSAMNNHVEPCTHLKNAITGIKRGIRMIANTIQATVCHWPVYQWWGNADN
jgi:hypothetical protein